MRESELFDRSCFVIKIKGYTFHNSYIPRDVCEYLGPVTSQSRITLDEDRLRSYRKEHGEYTGKHEDEITFVNSDGCEVGIVGHETGIEVFILSVAGGVAASIAYDLIKRIVRSFTRSIRKENERYPTEHDFDLANILLIKRRYSIRLGQIEKRSPTEFEAVYSLEAESELTLLGSIIESESTQEMDGDVLKMIKANDLEYLLEDKKE